MTTPVESVTPLDDPAASGPGRRGPVPAFAPAAAYMALIFFMSSRPAPEFAMLFPMWLGIKTLHVLEFGLLALLLARGLFTATRLTPGMVYVITIAATTLYGASDEAHQLLVEGRSARIDDVLADLIGALLFARLHPIVQRWRGFGFLRFRP
jgi:VanZ family protein